MQPVTIRVITPVDVSALAGLRRAWTEELDGPVDDPDYDTAFAAWYAAEDGRRVGWLAETGGRPVGSVTLALFMRMPRPGRPPSRWGYVANVFVLAEHRNRGIGRLLLDEVIRYAHRESLARLVLSPSERSVPLYRRTGFGPATMLMAQVLSTDPGLTRVTERVERTP